MLHDEFRLVVVVVIVIEVYGWKYIITGELKRTLKNLTIILPNSLKRTQIYIAWNKGETPSKLTRKFLIFLCLIKSSTCLKSKNEIKFANVSCDFDLFGKKCLCSPVYALMHDAIFVYNFNT